MPFDLGDVVPLSVSVYNAATTPVLINATTIALTITLPDGTTVTPTVTNPPAVTGIYVYDYAAPTSGRYSVRWVSTSPSSAHTDVFDVREQTPPLLFSLADGKKTLNISSTVTTNDDEIRDLIESTTTAVEFIVGPVVRQTVVEKHNGGASIVLRASPVLSIQSVAPVLTSGTSYVVSELDLDAATGELVRKDGNSFVGPLRITFTAGRVVMPAPIRDGARIILKHLWAIQNGSAGLPSFDADRENVTMVHGLGYALPNRALQLLEPLAQGPMVG